MLISMQNEDCFFSYFHKLKALFYVCFSIKKIGSFIYRQEDAQIKICKRKIQSLSQHARTDETQSLTQKKKHQKTNKTNRQNLENEKQISEHLNKQLLQRMDQRADVEDPGLPHPLTLLIHSWRKDHLKVQEKGHKGDNKKKGVHVPLVKCK